MAIRGAAPIRLDACQTRGTLRRLALGVLHRIQLTGQWFFLKAEGVFNLAFGDKLNPLYYLGPIAYYLMWLVVASGLYLYAFFETSVTGAYDSVEALTHAQPYAGGVLAVAGGILFIAIMLRAMLAKR